MGQYRKKPVVIDAVQWTGDNEVEINTFSSGSVKRHVAYEGNTPINTDFLRIQTLEGTMTADKKDWIIKGVEGEFYPCKPEIFEKTYEPVTE